MPKRSKDEVAPRNGVIPHIDVWETPSPVATRELMKAVAHGLNIEGCASYANVPSAYVRNWIARGRKQEMEPFDENKFDDQTVRSVHVKQHKTITIPCFNFWMLWKKTRATFLMGCVKKLAKSKDWHAHAWLLERVEPSMFAAPGRSVSLRRDLLPTEKEIEATVRDGDDPTEPTREVVQILLPDNKR